MWHWVTPSWFWCPGARSLSTTPSGATGHGVSNAFQGFLKIFMLIVSYILLFVFRRGFQRGRDCMPLILRQHFRNFTQVQVDIRSWWPDDPAEEQAQSSSHGPKRRKRTGGLSSDEQSCSWLTFNFSYFVCLQACSQHPRPCPHFDGHPLGAYV